MMNRTRIQTILNAQTPPASVVIRGWVRTRRDAKTFSFIEVNDGSCLDNLQVIAESSLGNYEEIKRLTTGSAVAVEGLIRESPGREQKWEMLAAAVTIYQLAPEDYPLQKKRHTDEYLRTIAHLRPRTNKYGAVFRIRSAMSFAVHRFFRDRGFFYVHTPILTASDCEGAGAMFQVTALDMENPPRTDGKAGGIIDYTKDLFGKPANLTVSGQLEGELLALALGNIYTFGPTFRAENSNTSRHAAEFWMVEPEMAFCDLSENMDLAEEFVRHLAQTAMSECADDLALFSRFVDKSLPQTLDAIASRPFVRISYTDAVEILAKSGKPFAFAPEFGMDLQTEHERFLAEEYFRQPVILYNYPKSIKAFYMRVNDGGETVAAMDVIVPRIGEIIGGSQREERLDVLESRMQETGIPLADYEWYLDSRRFGSVPHSGFGLGFERLIMLVTGISNIRDVIPFPRTPGNIEF